MYSSCSADTPQSGTLARKGREYLEGSPPESDRLPTSVLASTAEAGGFYTPCGAKDAARGLLSPAASSDAVADARERVIQSKWALGVAFFINDGVIELGIEKIVQASTCSHHRLELETSQRN